MWPRFSSVTVTTGSRDVIINSGESASNIIASDALVIGNFQLEEIESVLAGAGGKTVIRLFNPWSNNSLTQSAVVIPNPGDLRRARQALKDMEQLGIDTLVALNGIATSETKDFVTITDAAGTQYQVPTASFYQRKIATHEAALTQLYNDKKAALDTLIATNHLHASNGNDMEVRREQVRRITGGNGLLSWGKHIVNGSNHFAINQGLYTNLTTPNVLMMSRGKDGVGVSETDYAVIALAGFVTKISGLCSSSLYNLNVIKLPPAPNGTVSSNPNRTPVLIDHMTYKDPRYGGTDANGDKVEAIIRCFEGQSVNSDFRNGGEGWVYGSLVSIANGQASLQAGASIFQPTSYVEGKTYEVEVVLDNVVGTDISFRHNTDGTDKTGLQNGLNKFDFTYRTAVGSNPRIQVFSITSTCDVVSVIVRDKETQPVISRVDMWGFEASLQEVTPDNPAVYKNGLPQCLTSHIDGIPTSKSNRSNEYYAWYQGDEGSKGDSVDFFARSVIEQDTLLNNPDNNLFYLPKADGTYGIFQWIVKGRSFRGAGNGDWLSVDDAEGYYLVFGPGNYLFAQGAKDNIPGLGPSVQPGASLYCAGLGEAPWKDPDFKEKGLYKASTRFGFGADTEAGYNGECYFWVGGTLSRLNDAAYVQGHNEAGSKLVQHVTVPSSGKYWHYSDARKIHSTLDAFKYATTADHAGEIGGASGRPDGRYHDAIYPGGLGGVVDRFKSAQTVDLVKYADAWERVMNGTYRGLEKLKRTQVIEQFIPDFTGSGWVNGVFVGHDFVGNTISILLNSAAPLNGTSFCVGDFVQVGVKAYAKVVYVSAAYNRIEVEVEPSQEAAYASWLRTEITAGRKILVVHMTEQNISVSGEFTMQNVFGDPVHIRIVPELRDGFDGEWIPEIPDETPDQEVECTREFLGDGMLNKVAVTTDGGSTWENDTWGAYSGSSNPDNARNLWQSARHYPANGVWVLNYTAWARQTKPCANKAVQAGKLGLHDVHVFSNQSRNRGALLGGSLIGKALTSNGGWGDVQVMPLTGKVLDHAGRMQSANPPTHGQIMLVPPTNHSSAVKVLPYNIVENGKPNIAMAANELVHNGSSWGDSSKVEIVDDTGTYTNDNGDSCIAAMQELSIPLPYWADEKS